MSETQSSPQKDPVAVSSQVSLLPSPPHPLSLVAPASRELLLSLLNFLSSRMMFGTAKTFLTKAGVHVSRGWTETIANAASTSYPDSVLASACSLLTDLSLRHSSVGNKNVYFFNLKEQYDEKKNVFLDWVRGKAEMDLTDSLKQRPFGITNMPTTQKELGKIKKNEPFLFSVERFGNKVFFQFFSVRSYSKRVKISINQLTKSQQKVFSIYEELYGVAKNFVPCFDTVVVNLDSEILEYRIDFAPDMIGDTDVNPLTKTVLTFDNLVIQFTKNPASGAGLMDLLPAIKPMYDDGLCGKVTALGFVAFGKDASSNNQGKIQRSLTRDFRKDPFHIGGKGNVSKISPYAIGLHWESGKSDEALSLEIKGSARAVLSGKGSGVNCAQITGCIDEADFEFLRGQVLQRIKH